jgi:sodium transport system ATP-binding protein
MKTALGRAILHSPQNLLLDEPTNGLDVPTNGLDVPTNGLDVPTIRSLREMLRRLRDLGQCILFSSHVLDEVRPSVTR